MKCRCRKWACMSHLDICNTSYDPKKGRESNWQFDSEPLKVGNRPDPGACRRSTTHHWKAFDEKATRLLQTSSQLESEQKVIIPQSGGSPKQNNFGTLPWESRDKKPFECRCRGKAQRILYGGRWWLPASPGHGESCESKVAHGLS